MLLKSIQSQGVTIKLQELFKKGIYHPAMTQLFQNINGYEPELLKTCISTLNTGKTFRKIRVQKKIEVPSMFPKYIQIFKKSGGRL